jgi:hypothetical protein
MLRSVYRFNTYYYVTRKLSDRLLLRYVRRFSGQISAKVSLPLTDELLMDPHFLVLDTGIHFDHSRPDFVRKQDQKVAQCHTDRLRQPSKRHKPQLSVVASGGVRNVNIARCDRAEACAVMSSEALLGLKAICFQTDSSTFNNLDKSAQVAGSNIQRLFRLVPVVSPCRGVVGACTVRQHDIKGTLV